MFSKLLLVFKIPELRRKILLTLGLLAVYRLGFAIPLPFMDQQVMFQSMKELASGKGAVNQVMQIVSLFSASGIGNATIFGLGIMPYISASIIFQLLGSVYPPLEKLKKEGEAGQRKINELTRYATVVICLVQSFVMIKSFAGGLGGKDPWIIQEYNTLTYHILGAFTMTCGTLLLMWIGEQIDAYGIGNGISLLIMAGILARMPNALYEQFIAPIIRTGSVQPGSDTGIEKIILLGALFVGIVFWVILITQGQRRIPVKSQKHVRGRRMTMGQAQSLPLRVNQAGVMPIIFASSLLLIPYFLFNQLGRVWPGGWVTEIGNVFAARQYVYNVLFIGLIYFFCYFWTAIQFNPKEMAENLKDYGSFIPGYRPGKPTANHLEQVMVRITYVGAAFLALVAVIPVLVATSMNIPFMVANFYGGTGLLIVVSVVLDLVQKIDSHLVMRNYSGLLEADN